MVSNISVEYGHALRKYDEAKTPEEKLAALLEMQTHSPKHKGAENLRSDLSKKISELKNDIERLKSAGAKKSSGGATSALFVKKDGIAQVVIIGPPNVGKSTILNKLVGRDIAKVSPYPFTTTISTPAMMNYEGALIQLVELPAIIEGSSEGKAQGKEIIGMVRNADAVVIITPNMEEGKVIVSELAKSLVYLNKTKPPIEVKVSTFTGIQISGKEFLKFPSEQLEQYLKNSGYANSSAIITGQINSMSEVIEALNEKIVYKKAVAFNSYDYTDEKAVEWKNKIFVIIDKILVYTKKPGQDEEKEPFALDKGATITDLANALHKDFAKNLKFAKVWGSTKFPGQRVGPDYELQNKDIVEISA